MAEVFLATAHGAGDFARTVVLKRLDATLARDPDAVTLFLDEARTAARLHHHNICQVFDFGNDDEGYFLAMEYLDGVDVRALVRANVSGVELPAAITIAIGAAAGLHHAHELVDDRGRALDVVHRDVTAGNVFVTRDGGVKLIDFGIARAADRTTRTREGLVRGTVVYMSPEQVAGLVVDRRSDLFSLGVVLYELVTGRRPFDHAGDTDLVAMRRIETGVHASAASLRRDCPPDLDDVIEALLAVDPALRPQTGVAVVGALDDIARKRSWSTGALNLAGLVSALLPAAQATSAAVREAPTRARAPATIPEIAAQRIGPQRKPRVPKDRRRWLLGAAVMTTTSVIVVVAAATRSSGESGAPVRAPPEAVQCVRDAATLIASARTSLLAKDEPVDVRNLVVNASALLDTVSSDWVVGVRARCIGVQLAEGYASARSDLDAITGELVLHELSHRLVFAGTTQFGRVIYQDANSNKTLGDDELRGR